MGTKDNNKKFEGISRRSVLDWLGKGLVVGLHSPFLISCINGEKMYAADRPGDTDSTTGTAEPSVDTLTGGDTASDLQEPGSYLFAPGPDQEIFDGFVVFTVDQQNIADVLASWELVVDGMVENPTRFTFGDLLDLERVNQVTDFHCVTGWSVHDVAWNGVHISTLLDIARPMGTASHITFHSTGDVYSESLTMEEALEPRTIMGFGVNEQTLPLQHGFPLRLVMPRKYGYKNAKYVYRLELTDAPHFGYWENRGYSYGADVPPDRLRDGKY